ncbi:MAG: hypothetical protein ACRDMJ_10455 [Solirubrobacteraceae bacterium]
MPSAKLAAAIGLAALSLSACGTTSKPEAGTPAANAKIQRGLDDARTPHIDCLRQQHVAVSEEQVTVAGRVLPGLQVGSLPSGPTVAFEATPGVAQGVQIQGESQGAEVIGSALVYPNQASDALAHTVEACVALGVKG